ncbi:hypothetical protein G6F24_014151 [Rhizopus arrhizus]|nr:hypothetical protein G6F24_014151 [Rhizopus arrhizus]
MCSTVQASSATSMVDTDRVAARANAYKAGTGRAAPNAMPTPAATPTACAVMIQPVRRPSQGSARRSIQGAHRNVSPKGRYSANTQPIEASATPLLRRIGPMPPCTKPITAPSETYRAATAASGSQGEGGRAEVERVVMSELPAHADAGQPFLAKTHGTDRRPPALAGDQVLLVEQVVAVQAQRHVIVHRPRDHGVVHRVGLGECRRADGAVGTAVHAGGIAHAAAQGNAMRQHVAGPAGEGIVRGIDQVVGAIGGHLGTILHIGVQVATAQHPSPVCCRSGWGCRRRPARWY